MAWLWARPSFGPFDQAPSDQSRRILGETKRECASHVSTQVGQRMAQEASRLMKRRYPDVPVNVEAVQEEARGAVGTGSGIL